VKDSFLNTYLNGLNSEIEKLTDAMTDTSFKDLYQVGRVQGRIDGLRSAKLILEVTYKDEQI
jgi:hypothetical protein